MQIRAEAELVGICYRHAARVINDLLGKTYMNCCADIRFALDGHEASEK